MYDSERGSKCDDSMNSDYATLAQLTRHHTKEAAKVPHFHKLVSFSVQC